MIKSTNKRFLPLLNLIIVFIFFSLFSACGGGGGGGTDTGTSTDTGTGTVPGTTDPTVVTAATLKITTSSRTVSSSGTTFTTLTIYALNEANAVLPGVVITMSADTGILGAATITTGPEGTATVTFRNNDDPTNRTATITATAGDITATTLIQIVGSKITLTPAGTIGLSPGGTETTLTATVSDKDDNLAVNTPVTITTTGSGSVTVTPLTGVTDANGQFKATLAGATSGAVTLTVTALGATATKAITVAPVASSFGIDKQWRNGVDIGNPKPSYLRTIVDQLAIEVNAPSATIVVFATTLGSWTGGTNSIEVPVVGGKATATLTTTLAGIANVQVYDKNNFTTSDSLIVAMTSSLGANTITLQASSNVVPKSVGTTTGTSTLVATVRDTNNYLVANTPVLFSILNPTGGGENIYPVVVLTEGNGQATTTFNSGSTSSDPAGVQIRASVIGTAVATGTSPSGSDASIIIGGTGGSISFGVGTEISVHSSGANYILPMSVLVADSAGHAIDGARVSLSLWPVAWSTGINCTPDRIDGQRCGYSWTSTTTFYWGCTAGNYGTFYSEDVNANLMLDPGEDGVRRYYATGTLAPGTGSMDDHLTPVNSDGGALPPSDVFTDASGVASFDLTYSKASALWTTVKVRASSIVQGSETVSEIIFILPAMVGDVEYYGGTADVVKTCKLPDSHYIF